jgi:hypothetical protein
MTNEYDEATQKAMDKIEKLMRLASSNPNEAEAASALSKAQELLAAYNLDLSAIEANSGASGKRLDAMVTGGMHRYQRSLMKSIAQLNFCMYWTMKVPVKAGSAQAKRGRQFTHEHRLVGRQVNVIQTRNMADYLNSTIERLCRDKLRDDGLSPQSQFYSAWAIAFREGIADRVIEKLVRRRRANVDEEAQKAAEAARAASAAGTSSATGLTLASLVKREEAANYDFLHGEGAWARREAEWASSEKLWAERRVQEAAARAAAEKSYAEWAVAHPAEAAQAEAERAAAARKAEKAEAAKAARRSGRRYSFRQTGEELRRNSGGYAAGYEAGKHISIDPQTSNQKSGALSDGR